MLVMRIQAHEIAYVGIVESGAEICGGNFCWISGTNQDIGRAQFVGHHAEGREYLPCSGKLLCATESCLYCGRIKISRERPSLERQVHLFQIVLAPLRESFAPLVRDRRD